MQLTDLFFIALGLSMDAFAVAACKGLAMRRVTPAKALVVGLWFGAFQAVMPAAGYFAGRLFAGYITTFDHWIAFLLLAIIGGKMIWESRKADEALPGEEPRLTVRVMLPLALATSIDALAAGVTFAFVQVQITPAVAFIGTTTLLLSMLGVAFGRMAGAKLKRRAELLGGVILVFMGLRVLLEHLGVFVRIAAGIK
jgi:putative Mn2+ efflux pump MntP